LARAFAKGFLTLTDRRVCVLQLDDGIDRRLTTKIKSKSDFDNGIFQSTTGRMTVTFYSDSSVSRTGFYATANATLGAFEMF